MTELNWTELNWTEVSPVFSFETYYTCADILKISTVYSLIKIVGKQVKYQGRKEEEIIFADWIGSSQTVLLVYPPCYNSAHLAATLCVHFLWCRDQQAQPRKTSDLGLCVLKRLLVLSLTCTLEVLTWENADQDSFFPLISLMISFLETICMVKVKIAPSCPPLCDPVNYTVHGILQARILEWVAVPFSRGSSQPRDLTQVSCIAGRFFTSWAQGKPNCVYLYWNTHWRWFSIFWYKKVWYQV